MYGQWLRVSSAELEHAKADLDWAEDFAESVAEAEYQYEDNRDLPDRRSYGTDKAWHALDYLLQRKGFPVAIIFGEELCGEPVKPWQTSTPTAGEPSCWNGLVSMGSMACIVRLGRPRCMHDRGLP